MQRFIGAIDQGTAGTRFMVFDHDGQVVANAHEQHRQITPRQGWIEHDPTEIWEQTKAVVETALTNAAIAPEQLAAIGVTNQRETVLMWDPATGEPIHNALVWQDRRTIDRVEALHETDTDEVIRERTGLVPDPFFSAPKIEWLLDNAGGDDPPPRERGRDGDLLVGTIDAWLLYNLTGNHITDVTNASRTMLYDIERLRWDPDLLDEFAVPEAMLPEVRPSSDEETYGTTDPDGFLGAEVPVAGALGDQQAALFGQTCFDAGDAKSTNGTGCFLLMNTGPDAIASDNGLLTTIGFQRSGEPVQYALEGPVFSTGVAIEWLDDVDLVTNPAETAQIARQVDSSNGVYVVPAFTGLAAPHWDGRARGTIVGLTRGIRRPHLVRATVESIAFQVRDIVEAIEADVDIDVTTLRVDGGASKNNFLCQLQADLVQTQIVRPEVDETTALGAAYAAGLAVDYWADLATLSEHWVADRTFEPTLDQAIADSRYGRWDDAVARATDWERE